jgi:single-strand DNA-binding protein
MDLNRATLLGRLTRDPEIRSTPSGQSVATIGVATGRVWTDQSGVKQERTEFHNCVLWGKLADIAGQYLSKGRRVYLEGRLETKDWAGQDGVKRYRTEIIVENMIMLDGPRGSSPTGPGASAAPQSNFGDTTTQNNPDDEIKVEDIPF